MPNFTDALTNAVRGATCGVLAANSNLQGWWARNTDLPFTGALAAGAESARRALCDNPSPVPEQPVPFTGGQCPGTNYIAELTAQGGSPITTNLGQGPLQLVTTYFTVPECPGFVYQFRAILNGQDRTIQLGNNKAPGECQPDESRFTTVSNVRPNDGGPNDCGDPPPLPAPNIQVPVTVPIDITYVDNTNTEITELGDFNLFLPIFLPGSIQIPFNVDVGGVDITGNLDINGDITFEINPGRQPDDTTTDTPVPELPPGQEPVDPETERRIIGVHCFTTLPPNTSVTVIGQDDGPNIFAPRGGSVRFLVSGGSGASWTEDIDIKGDRQYIPCPAPQGAISVVANELPGGTVSLQRVFGAIPSYLIPE